MTAPILLIAFNRTDVSDRFQPCRKVDGIVGFRHKANDTKC